MQQVAYGKTETVLLFFWWGQSPLLDFMSEPQKNPCAVWFFQNAWVLFLIDDGGEHDALDVPLPTKHWWPHVLFKEKIPE